MSFEFEFGFRFEEGGERRDGVWIVAGREWVRIYTYKDT